MTLHDHVCWQFGTVYVSHPPVPPIQRHMACYSRSRQNRENKQKIYMQEKEEEENVTTNNKRRTVAPIQYSYYYTYSNSADMYKELKETQLKCINCCCCLLLYRRHCLSLYLSTCCTRTFVYIMGRHHQEWIDFHSFDSPMTCRPTAVYIFTQHDRQHHQYCVQFNLKYSFSNRAPFCFLNVDAGEIHRVPISMPSDEIDIYDVLLGCVCRQCLFCCARVPFISICSSSMCRLNYMDF